MTTLQCPKCDGPVIRFPRERRYICERCHSDGDKQGRNVRYRAAHKEQMLQADRSFYAQHKAEKLAYAKTYYEAHKQEILAKKRARDQAKKLNQESVAVGC